MDQNNYGIIALRQKPAKGLKLPLPYFIDIDGRPVCLLRGGGEVHIKVLPGRYRLRVKTGFAFKGHEAMISGERGVEVKRGSISLVEFTDHERVWNLLFDVDLLLWIAEFFFTLPAPWHTVYEVVSNGFFAIWLVRLFIIRKRYFRLSELRTETIPRRRVK